MARSPSDEVAIESWLTAALADADRRGLPELKPLLETLARATLALRSIDEELRRPDPPPTANTGP